MMMDSSKRVANILLLLQCLSFLRVGAVDPLNECTSRTLKRSRNFNNTVDALPPICPNGYFCDLMVAGNENKTIADDNVSGLCRPCAIDSKKCDAIVATNMLNMSNQVFLESSLEECQDQCVAETNTCASDKDCDQGLFCNFYDDISEIGYCESCPLQLSVCEDWSGNESRGVGGCREDHKQYCSSEIQFSGEILECSEEEYCDFSSSTRGFCQTCPENAEDCFFSNSRLQGAIECNEKCTKMGYSTQLREQPCKFCPSGSFNITDDLFDAENAEEISEPCEFCASSGSTCNAWEMKYPNRTILLFGNTYECWRVAQFYKNLPIEANSPECESIRQKNYICGCSDSAGYAGANTEAKQIALAWLPRIGAILSILGSTLLALSVFRDKKQRKKVIGELLMCLCGFDIIGSLGYAFTSYATPKEHYVWGAEGNDASCIAQGFFIQIGTIALYINVSIAMYYVLVVEYSWKDQNLRKSWWYISMFVCPILIGIIFAFAGIPFYGTSKIWCNNSALYWPEIPVVVAIAVATILLLRLCWYVYQSERVSRRFRQHDNDGQNTITKLVFKQALIYLAAFFLTWPAYLALQIMLANKRGYDRYGFFLFAGTSVTLQGFWNYVFHSGLGVAVTRSLSVAMKKFGTSFRLSQRRSHTASSGSSSMMNIPNTDIANTVSSTPMRQTRTIDMTGNSKRQSNKYSSRTAEAHNSERNDFV